MIHINIGSNIFHGMFSRITKVIKGWIILKILLVWCGLWNGLIRLDRGISDSSMLSPKNLAWIMSISTAFVMVKHIQTIRPLLSTNCLSVFEHNENYGHWHYSSKIFRRWHERISNTSIQSYNLILCDWSLSIPPENIRKTSNFLFSGLRKETSDKKWVNLSLKLSFFP